MIKKQYINVLLQSRLFHEISEDEILAYLSKAPWQIRKFNRNEFIFPAGEPCNWVDIILEGRADCHQAVENGNIMLSAHYYPGDEMGAIIYYSHHLNIILPIVAKTSCTVLRMSPELLALLHGDQRFINALITGLADRADDFVTKIQSVTLKSVHQHVMDFLEQEYKKQQSMELLLPATKKELAEQMGIQRQSLSRELKRMREEDLLTYDAKHIILKSRLLCIVKDRWL